MADKNKFLESFVSIPPKGQQPLSRLMDWAQIEITGYEVKHNKRRIVSFKYLEDFRLNQPDRWGVPSYVNEDDLSTLHVGSKYLMRAIRRDKKLAADSWVKVCEYEWIETVPLTPEPYYWTSDSRCWNFADDMIKELLELEGAAYGEEE